MPTLTKTTTKTSTELKIIKTIALTAVGLAVFSVAAGFLMVGEDVKRETAKLSTQRPISFHEKNTKYFTTSSFASASTVSTIQPNQLFIQSQSYPLDINKPVYTFSINADVNIASAKGLVRVVLVDKKQKEYLIHEAYPLIGFKEKFKLQNFCEETCLLEGIIPVKLKIQIEDATLKIKSINYHLKKGKLFKSAQDIASKRRGLKKLQRDYKINKLNQEIKKKGLKWTAGETSVSKLSYAEKKKLFHKKDGTPMEELPNLLGFEYYKGGIFELPTSSTQPSQQPQPTTLPASWDWRNVHGENWMTPVKDQGPAGNCWTFSLIGAIEAQINLYYNQHLDLDLSEQHFVDCLNEQTLPIGMSHTLYPECSGLNMCYPGFSSCVISQHGIADENCDPYVAREKYPTHCTLDYICSDWQDRLWKNADFHDYKFEMDFGTPECPKQTMHLNEESLKKVLIEKGPLHSGFKPWNHAMVLSGYQESQEGLYWIFKNSWGTGWGEDGYGRIISSLQDLGWGSLIIGPYTPPTNQSYWPSNFDGQIRCVDKDLDGYCNWGITSKKPDSCPPTCKLVKDCDDSNDLLGNCMKIKVRGDINQDDKITAQDLMLMIKFLKHVQEPTPEQKELADLDANQKIDRFDWVALQKLIEGKIDQHNLPILIGDVNDDQTVNSIDVVLIDEYLAGDAELSDIQLLTADANANQRVDDHDVEVIWKLITGIVSQEKLPIELGDFNDDDRIRSNDIIIAMKYLDPANTPTQTELLYGDMNLNGKFDQTDLDQIKKMWGKYTIENECLVPPVE